MAKAKNRSKRSPQKRQKKQSAQQQWLLSKGQIALLVIVALLVVYNQLQLSTLW